MGIEYVAFMPFITAIVIVWMVFHYRRQNRISQASLPEEQQTMERMVNLLEKMEGRIITLEKILEAEDPRWREKVPPTEHL
jgi:phage shock protein B